MEHVQSALAISLIAERNFVVQTNRYQLFVDAFSQILRLHFGFHDIVEIDLKQAYDSGNCEEIVDAMVNEDGKLHRVVIWKNLELLDTKNLRCKNALVKILSELEQYDTLASRHNKADRFPFGKYSVTKPDLFVVIPVIQIGTRLPKIHQHLKERFWFSQSCFMSEKPHQRLLLLSGDEILQARLLLPSVYAKPTIQEYILSLLVFTRSHRLCSLAPLTTRPTSRTLDSIMELSKALVVWKNRHKTQTLFVTPEYCKVAYRKIGYWLVDWETNQLFNGKEDEYRKQMEISMLTGDWYGSEWKCVEDYLEKHTSAEDKSLSTGFTNRVVEEVLGSVMPPI